MTTADLFRDAQHVGDGVYAIVDGGDIIIATSDGVAWSEQIVLDPATFATLIEFAKEKGVMR